MDAQSNKLYSKISLALAFAGIVAGIALGVGVLSGDDQGRVNLLLFLFLFAAIPLISLVLSAILLFRQKAGIASWLINLPFWPMNFSPRHPEFSIPGSMANWLFFQSQLVNLAFSIGTLLVFVALLLGTDVNFVWRSTLLDSEDLLPILEFISIPWRFWSEALPSLSLLDASQNSRIADASNAYSGNWWRFALGAQISYSLIPRFFLLLLAKWKYKQDILANSVENLVNTLAKAKNISPNEQQPLAALSFITPSRFLLLNWAGIPNYGLTFITKSFGAPEDVLAISALTLPESLDAKKEHSALVVVVKSWEPPLEELKDILLALPDCESKFILPLDWDDEEITSVTDSHLTEWRRFAATLDQWNVLQPGEHS